MGRNSGQKRTGNMCDVIIVATFTHKVRDSIPKVHALSSSYTKPSSESCVIADKGATSFQDHSTWVTFLVRKTPYFMAQASSSHFYQPHSTLRTEDVSNVPSSTREHINHCTYNSLNSLSPKNCRH